MLFEYSTAALADIIRQASGLSDDKTISQLEYLCGFLSNPEMGTKTIVKEFPYTDRHYTEEYRSYYSTIFRPPTQQATRLHFFREAWSNEAFASLIDLAASNEDAYQEVVERINESYLGFSVIRPLPSAPIGRTILCPFTSVPSRTYIQPLQRAHLAGFELKVHGVPFQQQETAVGACATTAIWSALAAAARVTGHRSPTPNQITEAATRHLLNNRAMPADGGLELAQVLESVRASGYEPYVIKPDRNFSVFSLAIKCYLASHIPVIVLLQGQPDYHAVTLVGYRVSDSAYAKPALEINTANAILRATGLTRVYVHEDRLGPYARMKWLTPEEHEAVLKQSRSGDESLSCDLPALQHEPYSHDTYGYSLQPMGIYCAVVPLSSNLRLSALGLISIAGELRSMFRMLLGPSADSELFIEPRFVLSGHYVEEVLRIGVQPSSRARRMATQMTLPRYVGILRFMLGETAVCDVICDASDILRGTPPFGAVLGFLSFDEKLVAPIQEMLGQLIEWAVVF